MIYFCSKLVNDIGFVFDLKFSPKQLKLKTNRLLSTTAFVRMKNFEDFKTINGLFSKNYVLHSFSQGSDEPVTQIFWKYRWVYPQRYLLSCLTILILTIFLIMSAVNVKKCVRKWTFYASTNIQFFIRKLLFHSRLAWKQNLSSTFEFSFTQIGNNCINNKFNFLRYYNNWNKALSVHSGAQWTNRNRI